MPTFNAGHGPGSLSRRNVDGHVDCSSPRRARTRSLRGGWGSSPVAAASRTGCSSTFAGRYFSFKVARLGCFTPVSLVVNFRRLEDPPQPRACAYPGADLENEVKCVGSVVN